jgi:hypothetical protein
MNPRRDRTLGDRLKNGLSRINSTYPDLPLVPLNGNKQPLGDNWQNRPMGAAELIKAINDGGVEVSSSGRSKKIQPQGFGVLTGRPIAIDGQTYYLMALDQDGEAAAQKILSHSGGSPLPPTVAFTSGRSGRCQYLFLVPQEYKNAIKTQKIKTGTQGDEGKEELLEFRWKNLQSVLPPSVHPTTGEYRWVEGCAIDEIKIAIAPTWIVSQMSLSEPKRIEQPLKHYPQASISPVSGSSRSQSQLPRHPEQIQIPLPSAVPLEICCRTQVRDWIASGVPQGSGRNDTAIAVGLELVAVERYLQALGQPVELGARQLFGEYCRRSGMTDREEEERWRWCESKEPTPSCSSEGISACLRGWYWRSHVKPLQNSQITHEGLTIKEAMDYERGSANAERTLDSTSEPRTSPLPITNSQPIEPETMLPEKDKMDARHIGENMQQIPQQTTLIAASLVKTIFAQIRKNPTLQKDLAVDITKPTSVSINVDGKIAYKGLEGKKPLVNSVEPEDLQVVAKALTLSEGETLDESRDISITVNGKEVFKVERGKLLFNQFSPQMSQNLSESLDPNGQSHRELDSEASLSERELDARQMTDDRKVRTFTQNSETPLDVSETQAIPETTANDYRVITDSYAPPVTIISPEPPQKQPIEPPSIPTVQFSPHDKQQLTSLGLDPSSLEAAAHQKLAAHQMTDGKQVQYVPVVIIANSVEKEASLPNRSRFSQLLDSIKAAPQKISLAIKSGLGRIKDALAKTGSQISASFASLTSNERSPSSRRQDLNNIAALYTAKDAIFSLGVTTNDGRKVFAGQHYAFSQKGDNITITSANRGTILAYDAQSGFLKGNLSVSDVKVFSEFSSLLDKEKSASRERSVANSTQSKQMEIG